MTNTAHGKAVGVVVVVGRVDARVVEVQVVPVGAIVRSRRPVVPVGALVVHVTIGVVAVTRSRLLLVVTFLFD